MVLLLLWLWIKHKSMWYRKAATSHVLLEIKAVSFLAERPLGERCISEADSITLPWNLTESSGEVIQESRVTALPLPLCPGASPPWGFPSIPHRERDGTGSGLLPVLPRLGGVGGALNSSLPSSESILSNQASAAWFIAIQHSCWFICRM